MWTITSQSSPSRRYSTGVVIVCPGRSCISVRLALHAADGEPFDEEPLEDEEDSDYGQDDERRGRHQQTELHVVERTEELQPDGKRVLALGLQVDQGSDEIVPRMDRREDRHDRNRGPTERQDDPVEDLQ